MLIKFSHTKPSTKGILWEYIINHGKYVYLFYNVSKDLMYMQATLSLSYT